MRTLHPATLVALTVDAALTRQVEADLARGPVSGSAEYREAMREAKREFDASERAGLAAVRAGRSGEGVYLFRRDGSPRARKAA